QEKEWEVDIRFTWSNGTPFRERRRSPVSGRSATRRWAEAREAELLRAGNATFDEAKNPSEEVPTLEAFKPRFIEEWCKANKHKPSGIESKEGTLRNYLLPLFGKRLLDSFDAADEDRLKKDLVDFAASTYNNAATTLNSMLK